MKSTALYDTDALKAANPLTMLLERDGHKLQRQGVDTYRAHCPFHPDDNPSLVVYERDEHFHCYGCGAHGDVIAYVMLREGGIPFVAACELLADPTSSPRTSEMSVSASGCLSASSPAKGAENEGSGRQWDRLALEEQEVMNTACAVYQRLLWRTPQALAYLKKRGIPDRVARECRLGYADGHSLQKHLQGGKGLDTARRLGLLASRRGAGREHLAGRIVVPELRNGNCIWMIGRCLDKESARRNGRRPRFVALGGEKPVLGYERAAGREEVFLCEGVFDYLTAVGWKLAAFSPCGTSFPAERMGFLARARRVYGLLDGDDAGRRAAGGFGRHLGERFQAVHLPDGCDLNDLGRDPRGYEKFLALLEAARRETQEEARDGR
ncbi:MAG: CHC2 zinc finger domain-containing protein [Chloroflexota bacterium]|nr:CHC2 zinc finger domain-containing protein [Chloroflexota bacterium]